MGRRRVRDVDGSGGLHPALWEAGRLTDLSGDAPRSSPGDLNDHGQVLVRRYLRPEPLSSDSTVGLWSDGTFTPIVPPSGTRLLPGAPLDLLESGAVVGTLGGPGGEVPFLWRDGVFTDLAGTGRVRDTNRDDQVLLAAGTGARITAGIWKDGTTTTLVPPDGAVFLPEDLSDDGRVAGRLIVGDGHDAVVWDRGEFVDLGHDRVATLVNEHGIVVGFRSVGDGGLQDVVWVDGRMIDLGESTHVHALNNRDQFVGTIGDDGEDANGVQGTAVLWRVTG